MNLSIARKLPLFVTVLLLAVAIAQLSVGYGSVRKASRALADKRLPLATGVLADLLQTSPTRARLTALAKDSSVLAFLPTWLRSGARPGLAAETCASMWIAMDESAKRTRRLCERSCATSSRASDPVT